MPDSDVTLRPQQVGQGTNDVILFPFTVSVYTYINAADSGLGADSLAALSANVSVADAGIAIEGTVQIALTFTEVAAGLDVFSAQVTLPVADTGSGADAVSWQAQIPGFDAGTAVELFSKDFQVLDSGLGGDRFAVRVLRSGRLQYMVRMRVTENVFDPSAFDPYAYE
ncbi:MAG: hypothetical protein ABSC50_03095 [Candidatus Bathyarchaeia archaeon]